MYVLFVQKGEEGTGRRSLHAYTHANDDGGVLEEKRNMSMGRNHIFALITTLSERAIDIKLFDSSKTSLVAHSD